MRSWLAVPEWIELAMDSFFFNRWEGTEVYEAARNRLEKESDKDRATEKLRGLLYPDTLPQI